MPEVVRDSGPEEVEEEEKKEKEEEVATKELTIM